MSTYLDGTRLPMQVWENFRHGHVLFLNGVMEIPLLVFRLSHLMHLHYFLLNRFLQSVIPFLACC